MAHVASLWIRKRLFSYSKPVANSYSKPLSFCVTGQNLDPNYFVICMSMEQAKILNWTPTGVTISHMNLSKHWRLLDQDKQMRFCLHTLQ